MFTWLGWHFWLSWNFMPVIIAWVLSCVVIAFLILQKQWKGCSLLKLRWYTNSCSTFIRKLFRKLLTDKQAKTNSRFIAFFVFDHLEHFEDFAQVFWFNANACILDFYLNQFLFLIVNNFGNDFDRTMKGEFNRISDEIE